MQVGKCFADERLVRARMSDALARALPALERRPTIRACIAQVGKLRGLFIVHTRLLAPAHCKQRFGREQVRMHLLSPVAPCPRRLAVSKAFNASPDSANDSCRIHSAQRIVHRRAVLGCHEERGCAAAKRAADRAVDPQRCRIGLDGLAVLAQLVESVALIPVILRLLHRPRADCNAAAGSIHARAAQRRRRLGRDTGRGNRRGEHTAEQEGAPQRRRT